VADLLQVGWKIKDNDPRVNYSRVLTIIEVLPNGVLAEDRNRRVFTILRRRIYTDGKPRRNGFSLLIRTAGVTGTPAKDQP
jgi:hypothetical protein